MSTSPPGPGRGAVIAGIGLAVPGRPRAQSEIADTMIDRFGDDPRLIRKIRVLYRASGIEHRHGVVSPEKGDGDGLYRRAGRPHTPGTAERMAAYATLAPPLVLAAVADLEARVGLDAIRAVDHLVVATCTGFVAPGLDVRLARDLGLRADLGRTVVGFQGCHGGLAALRIAGELARARPGMRCLVVAVELSSLHLQDDPGDDDLRAGAIFADGAAAVLVTGEEPDAAPPLARLGRAVTLLRPDETGAMSWQIGDTGFTLRLSARLPGLIDTDAARACAEALAIEPRTFRELAFHAVHPGGVTILDAVMGALGLPDGALDVSRDVLRRFGNMSSATVFFVLREHLERNGVDADVPGIAMAFGPGLTIEAVLVHASGGRS